MKILDSFNAERLREVAAAHQACPLSLEEVPPEHSVSSICLWEDLGQAPITVETAFGYAACMPDQAFMSGTYWRIISGLLISAVSNTKKSPEVITFATSWVIPKIKTVIALNLEDSSGLVKHFIEDENNSEDVLDCEYHFEVCFRQRRLLMDVTSKDEVESLESYPMNSEVKSKGSSLESAFSSEAHGRARFLERMIKISKKDTMEHRVSYTACLGMHLINMMQEINALEKRSTSSGMELRPNYAFWSQGLLRAER